MAEEKEIRQSENKVEVVGKVSEYNITVKQKRTKCNIDGEEKEVISATIYGDISISVNGEIKKAKILLAKHTKNGTEKKNFAGLCTCAGIQYDVVDGKIVYSQNDRPLQPIIGGKTTLLTFNGKKDKDGKDEYNKQEFEHKGVGVENASTVQVVGSIDRNLYLKKDKSDLVCDKSFAVTKITTNTTETDKASFVIEGYVNEIWDETDINNNPTGRKMVELIPVNFFGVNKFTFVVPKSWEVDGETITAQDFVEFCNIGETVTLNGDIQDRVVGEAKPNGRKKSFGKKADITNGFTVTEWVVKGGDKDETKANFYNREDIEPLLKEYEMFLDSEYKKRCEYEEERAKQSNNTNKQGLGRRSPSTTASDDNDENPFVMDDDNPFA